MDLRSFIWRQFRGRTTSVCAVVLALAVIASGCARPGSEATPTAPAPTVAVAASQEPTPDIPEQPLPVGEGTTVLAVLDPAVEAPATSADEALALAREVENGSFVGEHPRIQLVHLGFRDVESAFGAEWTGWIILSTDIPLHWQGSPYGVPPAPTPSVTYTWVYVSLDGEVMDSVGQDAYIPPASAPPLP